MADLVVRISRRLALSLVEQGQFRHAAIHMAHIADDIAPGGFRAEALKDVLTAIQAARCDDSSIIGSVFEIVDEFLHRSRFGDDQPALHELQCAFLDYARGLIAAGDGAIVWNAVAERPHSCLSDRLRRSMIAVVPN